jgi:hypothetical protein
VVGEITANRPAVQHLADATKGSILNQPLLGYGA